jgi:guanylate kinase
MTTRSNPMTQAQTPGNLFIVTAPSGAGKTSLVKALLDATPGLKVSVSYTTRAPRPGEQHGTHYFFVDKPAFERMIQDGAFLEHANVFGNYYGTARQTVAEMLAQGTDVILEIDWQGAQQVRKLFPKAVGIFILPPSRAELESRLRNRKTDDEQVIARRLSEAIVEMSHYAEFDYLVVNDQFDRALADLKSIVTARRLSQPMQKLRLADTLAGLLR